jgi:hypothetical protein
MSKTTLGSSFESQVSPIMAEGQRSREHKVEAMAHDKKVACLSKKLLRNCICPVLRLRVSKDSSYK